MIGQLEPKDNILAKYSDNQISTPDLQVKKFVQFVVAK